MNEHKSNQEARRDKLLHRRKFLQNVGVMAAGSVVLPAALTGMDMRSRSAGLAGIALQLYSVRNELAKNMADTLLKVSEIGFRTVETAFWPESVTTARAGKYLSDAGLSVSSAHVELPVGDKKNAMLETAEAFRCKRMIWHGWPEDKRYSSLNGTKELADIYNEANHFAKSNGLQFGLHNHWWEYRNKLEDGRFVYQVLLERLDPDIFFEIDTYWVKVAGHDPAKIVGEFGKRAPLLHIKDGPARFTNSLTSDKPEPMVAVGKGVQNFPAIVKAANGNTEWMVVEMDNTATDIFTALRESYVYLVKNNLVKGTS